MTVFAVPAEQAGITLAAGLRALAPQQSWSQVRRLVAARRVQINGEPCLDPARRLKEGDSVELLDRAPELIRGQEAVLVRYFDEHVVVVEKPSGISTVRHPSEREWNQRRKALSPTLEDIVPRLVDRKGSQRRKGPLPRLRVVHRLDKETSGLVVFARTVTAERELGRQFRQHTVVRRYLAIVPESLVAQTIRTRLVRDRGDGRRGSTSHRELGKKAVTHIEIVEKLPGFTLIACRLETGRTHQIRIHLAELGHPICGEKVYNRPLAACGFALAAPSAKPKATHPPRLALHATELGFAHPVTHEAMHWSMPLPPDLTEFVEKLRRHER